MPQYLVPGIGWVDNPENGQYLINGGWLDKPATQYTQPCLSNTGSTEWTLADVATGVLVDVDPGTFTWSGSNFSSGSNPGSLGGSYSTYTGTPTKLAADANGYDTISFGGTSGIYLPSAALPAGDLCVFYVVKQLGAPPGAFGCILGQLNHLPGFFLMEQVNTSGSLSNGDTYAPGDKALNGWSSANTNVLFDNIVTPPASSGYDVTMAQAGATADWSHNGTTVASNFATLAARPAATSDLIIGTSDFGSYFCNVALARLLVYQNPTADEKKRIMGYLAWRYGIQADLPSGYPFKTASPKKSLAASLLVSRLMLTSLLSSSTPVARAIRGSFKYVLAQTTLLAVVTKQALKYLLATTTPVAQALTAFNKLQAVSAVTTPVSSMIKETGRSLLAATSAVADLIASFMSGSTTYYQNVLGESQTVATIQRASVKTLQASTTLVADLTKSALFLVASVCQTIGETLLNKATVKTLGAESSPVAYMTKLLGLAVNALANSEANLSKVVSYMLSLAASSEPVASIRKTIQVYLQAATTLVGDISKGLALAQLLNAESTPEASTSKASLFVIGLNHTTEVSVSVYRLVGKGLSASGSVIAQITKGILKYLSADNAAESSLGKLTNKAITSATSVVSSLQHTLLSIISLAASSSVVASLESARSALFQTLQASGVVVAQMRRSGAKVFVRRFVQFIRNIGNNNTDYEG